MRNGWNIERTLKPAFHGIHRMNNHSYFVQNIKIKEGCQNKNSAPEKSLLAQLVYRVCLERTSSRKDRMRG